MDSSSILQIIGILICILFSSFFSASETAYTSMNRVRVKNMAQNGNKRAEKALRLSDRYDKLLTTILIGNNIVNILAASLATLFFTRYFKSAGAVISTVVLTVVILIFGEISPKTIAKENPEKLALAMEPALRFFLKVLTPFSALFGQWKKLLGKMFRFGEKQGITEKELITMLDEAQVGGSIGAQEGELIRSAIEFNDLEAGDILTPRVDVEAVEIDSSVEEVLQVFLTCAYTRLPVYHDNIDRIVGVIHEKDFYAAYHKGAKHIYDIVKQIVCVTGNTNISELMKILQQEKSHMAVVIDEFGGTEGILTMEDIIEELVGDILDEHDEEEHDIQKVAENIYRIHCGADLEDLLELFSLEREYDCSTVAGWVVIELGRIPEEGDTFTCENLNVVVLKTDGKRVLEIEVSVQP